jgi:hypothetical protein
MGEPIPLKDVLADPAHPAYAAATDMLAKLQSGEISLCACLGPMHGEPYCGCEMRHRGLPLNLEARAAAQEHARAQHDDLARWFAAREGT